MDQDIFMADHGAGIHASNDSMFDHYYKISDKIICPARRLVKKKNINMLAQDIFKKLEHKNLKNPKSLKY